ncbi:hypothetical protein NYA30BAC_01404 [Halomonas sp. NYA30]
MMAVVGSGSPVVDGLLRHHTMLHIDLNYCVLKSTGEFRLMAKVQAADDA